MHRAAGLCVRYSARPCDNRRSKSCLVVFVTSCTILFCVSCVVVSLLLVLFCLFSECLGACPGPLNVLRVIPTAYSVRIARPVAISDSCLLCAAPSDIVATVVLHRRKVETTVGVHFFLFSVSVLSLQYVRNRTTAFFHCSQKSSHCSYVGVKCTSNYRACTQSAVNLLIVCGRQRPSCFVSNSKYLLLKF